MASVTLVNVRKVYPGGIVALHPSQLEIEDTELMVLVGPSGCGKTTTLRMIAGLEEVTEGVIKIGDRVVNDVLPKDRDIAMVFQNYAIYPHMTVYENMAFGLRQKKIPKNEIEQRIRQVAATLGLASMLARRPKALSGGQRQRVALGRAIVREPKVFLFDEPLSNLDAKMRVEMRKEIKLLHQRLQTTMIYVTHDQVEAMTLGDRICVMDHGVIEQVGAPLEVYDRPRTRFVAGFVGTPPMNFIPGILSHRDGHLLFLAETFEYSLPDWVQAALPPGAQVPVELGVRPEDLARNSRHAAEPAIPGDVQIVESLGNEQLVYFSCGKHTVIGRFDAHERFQVGEREHLAPNPEKLHLFDSTTGKNLLLASLSSR